MTVLGLLVMTRYTWNRYAGMAESVDARDLNHLSALGETQGAELLKFGETFHMAIPSQARPGRTAGAKV
jgi:hypothetical protein